MSQDDGFLSRWSKRKAQLARDDALPLTEQAPAPASGRPAATALATAASASTGSAATARASTADTAPAAAGAATADGPRAAAEPQAPAPPPPTLEEARGLGHDADFTRFVGRDVDPEVRNAALKNLFSDPQFNVMDGLDIYIDDYGKPDPLPPGMLERMTQSAFLGLFRKTPEEEAAARAPAQAQSDPNAAAPELPAPAAARVAPATPDAALPASPGSPAPAAPTDPLDPSPDEDPDLRLQWHDDAGRPRAGEGPEPDPGGQR